MRPVHEATQVVPFVKPAKTHPVANGDRDTFRDIDVVSYQQGPVVRELQYEPLMADAVDVIGN